MNVQVLEVNSCIQRSKANVLSMLREATQSHQVTLRDNPQPVLPPTTPASRPANGTGLLSFFKKKKTVGGRRASDGHSVSSKPKDTNGTSELAAATSQVTLATATLLLLEEVGAQFLSCYALLLLYLLVSPGVDW